MIRSMRRGWLAAGAILPLVTGLLVAPAQADGDVERRTGSGRQLAGELQQAVHQQRFDRLMDRIPPGTESARSVTGKQGFELDPADRMRPAADEPEPVPAHQIPNVDAAVIELGADGRPTTAANVLVSPQYPKGVTPRLDANFGTDEVRWRKWKVEEWNAGGRGSTDLVPGREDAPYDFMSPYPASVMKLMVGFGVLQLVDSGELSLDEAYSYQPADGSCGEAGTARISTWLDAMITRSDNRSSCALIMMLHQRNKVDGLNAYFDDLGLSTLQLKGTNPETGGKWTGISMSAVDTARLLLIVSGAPGTLWKTPKGRAVTADELSASSRAHFERVLGEQGLNHSLSTPNWCGRDYPAAGLPAGTARRWLHPTDGTATVDDRVYGQDVRPCNEAAEATFAHKTGLTDEGFGDAGIVRSLPDTHRRDYIVVVFGHLGMRYFDPHRPDTEPGTYEVPHTEKIGKLGGRIDDIMTERAMSPR